MTIGRIMAAASAAMLAWSPLPAAQGGDADWPCIQRKQPRLSPGAMWAGPPLDETSGAWKQDDEVAALVPVLAVRRTGLEEAETLIARFADGLGAERNARLALLFAGAFELIDRERREIMAGIGRYAVKQRGLAEALDVTRDSVAKLAALEEPSYDQLDQLEALEDKLAWDTRIYNERAEALTYVCESPVLLEQRVFALARAIMAHLE